MIADPCELNLRHLRALLAVRQAGSISAGSHLSNLTQSALTQAIGKLERQLDCTLFERRSSGIELTAEGTAALERITSALRHLDQAVLKLRGGAARASSAVTMLHVRALLSLAHARSLAEAAAAANWSQSSIHRAVGDLEQLLGRSLVDRRGQGTTLNVAGRRLLQAFRLLRGELRSMLSEISSDEHAAVVSLGALPIARPFIVPTAITQMVRANEHVQFLVAEGNWGDLVEQLQDGVIDLVVGALRNEEVAGLRQEVLTEDQTVILCGNHHPLARNPAPRLDELASYPWIVTPPLSPLRSQWEALFPHALRPKCPVECESVMVVINLLAHGDFLTLASPHQVELPMRAGKLSVVGPSIEGSARSVGLIMRKSWRPTPVQRQFIALLTDAARCGGAAPIAADSQRVAGDPARRSSMASDSATPNSRM